MVDVRKMLNADYSARFFSTIRRIERVLCNVWHTCVMRIKCNLMGVKLGKNVSFNGPVHIERFKYSTISIGNNVIFNSSDLFNPRGVRKCILQTGTDHACIEVGDNTGLSGVTIVSNERVVIGKNVNIGAETIIGDRDDHHEIFGNTDAPVCIEDDVFIGMHCIILKGVTIGKGSIIGAGSVVTKDIPAGVVAAGVPCRVIRNK